LNVIVPDASVLLKWVLPAERETHTEQALAIRQAYYERRCRLVLPTLWVYEVGNILSIKQPRLAAEALHLLVAMKFQTAETSADYCTTVFELVARFKVSFYDAAYHAVAILNQGVFVTADERYLRKAAADSRLVSLKDWR
jgi:predicted nucleic acid-binding protein